MKNTYKRIQQLEERILQIEDRGNKYGIGMNHILFKKEGKLYSGNEEWTDELKAKHPKHIDCVFIVIDFSSNYESNI